MCLQRGTDWAFKHVILIFFFNYKRRSRVFAERELPVVRMNCEEIYRAEFHASMTWVGKVMSKVLAN
jgi:hypothetical protein